LLVDRLPSGLEIDNPRLVEGGDISNLEWLKHTLKPQHTEFRDDRFVASFDLAAKPAAGASDAEEGEAEDDATPAPAAEALPKASAAVAYIVRAVTPDAALEAARRYLDPGKLAVAVAGP
jgi:hypothetical protein